MSERLTLGDGSARNDEGVWFNIVKRDGTYVLWSEADDDEFRDLFGYGPSQELPQVRIRRFRNPSRAKYQRDAVRKYSRLANMPAELEEKIAREAVAHTVLTDWRRLALKEGAPEEYTPKLGYEAFKQDPDFYEAIVEVAVQESYFRDSAIAEDVEALGN